MNIYKYYNGDSLLDGEFESFDKNPHYFWKRLVREPKELRKREKYIALDPYYALQYAIGILQSKFPAGEAAIATHPEHAVSYAEKFFNHGRFKKAEPNILKADPNILLRYLPIMNGLPHFEPLSIYIKRFQISIHNFNHF